MRRAFLLAVLLGSSLAGAVPLKHFEGSLWGFPSLTDSRGRPLADGRVSQWNGKDGLHAEATYDFGDGRVLEEDSLFSQDDGQLAQLRWTWQLRRGDTVIERYSVNFETGAVTAFKLEDGKRREWKKKLEVTPGRTFAGVGFVYAVKNLRARLVKGEKITLEAIGFMPRPQKAKVTLSHAGVESVAMGRRELRADHFVIHPNVPRIARLFIKVPDNHLWLYRATPPAFLRSHGPMMGLGDVRIDVLPSAEPRQTGQARRRAGSR